MDASPQAAKCDQVNKQGSFISGDSLADRILGAGSSESTDWLSLRPEETQEIRRYSEFPEPEACEQWSTFPVTQGALNLSPSIDTIPYAVLAPPTRSNPVVVSAVSTPSDYIGYPMQSMPYTPGTELIRPSYALVSNYADENSFFAPTPGRLPTTSLCYQAWNQDSDQAIPGLANYATQSATQPSTLPHS